MSSSDEVLLPALGRSRSALQKLEKPKENSLGPHFYLLLFVAGATALKSLKTPQQCAGSLSLQGSTRAHLIAALYELHSYLLPGRLVQGQLHEAESAAVQVPYLAYTPHQASSRSIRATTLGLGRPAFPATDCACAQGLTTLLGRGGMPQPGSRVGRAGLCLPAHSRGAHTHLLILGVRPKRLHVVLYRHVGLYH